MEPKRDSQALPAPTDTPQPQQPADGNKNEKNNSKKSSRSLTLWWVSIAILIIALAWLLYWLLYLQYHEYTDDAYANGNMINITPAVAGSVIAFYADDTDLVIEGQILVLLDKTNYQLAYDREIAALGSAVLQVRQLFDTVAANRANVESKRIALARAKYDYENRLNLVNTQAISNEEFIHSKENYQIAKYQLEQAEYQLKASQDAAGNTPLEKHPLIEQQKARVRSAFYDLQHCSIYAPATGYVAQRAVEVGQWVSPSSNLMAIIPTDYVWVDANFKETQLTYMRVGQPAKVWFDLYGSHVAFQGKVLGIASGSGSVFSIIPPQNATGNWIKIVQRLPVRIGLDPELLKRYPMRLGISSEVDVDITDQNLPMLAQVPPNKPVDFTWVFDISMEEVNRIIEEVIHKNMKNENVVKNGT